MAKNNQPNLYFGNLKPKEKRMSEGYTREQAQSFEIANSQFSVGFQLDWNGTEKTPENAKKLYEEQNADYEKKPLHRLIDDVEAGDLILIAPYGVKNPLRYIGRFTADPWEYGTQEHERMDVVNFRRVEDWVAVDRAELPARLFDYSAQQVLVNCRAASDDDIEELENLYRKKRVELRAENRYEEEASAELYLGDEKVIEIPRLYFTKQQHTLELFEDSPENVVKELQPFRGVVIKGYPTQEGLETWGASLLENTVAASRDFSKMVIKREDGSELDLEGVSFNESIEFKDHETLEEALMGRKFLSLTPVDK